MPKSYTCESERGLECPEKKQSIPKPEVIDWTHAFPKRIEYSKIKIKFKQRMRQDPKKIRSMMVPGEKNESNKAQKPNQNKTFRAQVGNKKKSKKLHTIKNKQEK